MTDRKALFDAWAESYDASLESDGFPFAGYEAVLNRIVAEAGPERAMSVLELGTGTGNLAARLLERGCFVTATDFSMEMLREARDKLPGAELIKLDVLGDWTPLAGRRFERVVSSYVFHEFPLDVKLELLERAARHLEAEGRIVIGDIAFPTRRALEAAQRRYADVWDESEHYWVAEEALAALRQNGLEARFEPISFCAGVFVLEPST